MDEWDDISDVESVGSYTSDKFRDEIGMFDRVELPGEGLLGEIPQNRVERALMNPLQRFRIYVDAIARNLTNLDNIGITNDDIHFMLEKAENLTAVNHKNPSAYILGYLATNGGKSLEKDTFDTVVRKILPNVEDQSITPPDIIRYSKLWINLRKL